MWLNSKRYCTADPIARRTKVETPAALHPATCGVLPGAVGVPLIIDVTPGISTVKLATGGSQASSESRVRKKRPRASGAAWL